MSGGHLGCIQTHMDKDPGKFSLSPSFPVEQLEKACEACQGPVFVNLGLSYYLQHPAPRKCRVKRVVTGP